MSASMAAVSYPNAANVAARFAVTEDLPTPPLPDAMAKNTGFDARLVERILFAFGLEACHKLGELVLTHGPDFDARQQCRFRI